MRSPLFARDHAGHFGHRNRGKYRHLQCREWGAVEAPFLSRIRPARRCVADRARGGNQGAECLTSGLLHLSRREPHIPGHRPLDAEFGECYRNRGAGTGGVAAGDRGFAACLGRTASVRALVYARRRKGPETVMLGYGYWRRRFRRRSIGRREEGADQRPAAGGDRHHAGKLPLHELPAGADSALRFNRGEVHLGNFSFQAIARLKPEATLAQATADIARMLPLMFRRFPAPQGMSAKAFEEAQDCFNLRPFKQDVMATWAR